MLTVTMTAGMIGAAILVAMVVCVGGVILAVMGGMYLMRNRRERHDDGAPRYSAAVTVRDDPAGGAIAGNFDATPQMAEVLSGVAADVPETDRAKSEIRLWHRERRRSVALVVVGMLLALAGLATLVFLIAELAV